MPELSSESVPPPATRTRVRPMWNFKLGIFTVLATGLGLWGVVDLAWIYPANGRRDVAYKLYQYFRAVDEAPVRPGTPTLVGASVENPVEARSGLLAIEEELRTEVESAQLRWLNAIAILQMSGFSRDLSRVGAANVDPIQPGELVSEVTDESGQVVRDEGGNAVLELDNRAAASRTAFADPTETYRELRRYWDGKDTPSGLTALDLPSQWLFVLVGAFGLVWLVPKLIRVNMTTHTYDPGSKTITLADGTAISPETLLDVDGRSWDKFFVYLQIDGMPGEKKVDLYPWLPLEAWLEGVVREAGLDWPGGEPAEAASDFRGAGGDGLASAEPPEQAGERD